MPDFKDKRNTITCRMSKLDKRHDNILIAIDFLESISEAIVINREFLVEFIS